MNRTGPPGGRATVASKTTFEALTVDSGEESADEEVEQPVISDRSACCDPLILCREFSFILLAMNHPNLQSLL